MNDRPTSHGDIVATRRDRVTSEDLRQSYASITLGVAALVTIGRMTTATITAMDLACRRINIQLRLLGTSVTLSRVDPRDYLELDTGQGTPQSITKGTRP